MSTECDNLSVGVIIEKAGTVALLKRARFPVGIAPPAGHIDQHGSPEQTAINEVGEELGLVIALNGLVGTAIAGRRMNNTCRRVGGDHHLWWVFKAYEFQGTLSPSPQETEGAGWYSGPQLQGLADRTREFQRGAVAPEDWQQNPGLEEIWLGFFKELGYVD